MTIPNKPQPCDSQPPGPPVCLWCSEAILPTDIPADVFSISDHHYECSARMILGSVAHIQRRCSCFVPGSTEGDPPGMTRREAARCALATYRRIHVEEAPDDEAPGRPTDRNPS